MLQEDKDDAVRETVVRNLALLLLYVDDADKFNKVRFCLNLLFCYFFKLATLGYLGTYCTKLKVLCHNGFYRRNQTQNCA